MALERVAVFLEAGVWAPALCCGGDESCSLFTLVLIRPSCFPPRAGGKWLVTHTTHTHLQTRTHSDLHLQPQAELAGDLLLPGCH